MDPLTTVTIMMMVVVTVFVFLFANVGLALTNHGEFMLWRVSSSRRIVLFPAGRSELLTSHFSSPLGFWSVFG